MKSRTVFIAIILITFGGIFVADELGFWKTQGSKVPTLIKEGVSEGLPNPEDIKGSYTFLDIEKAFGIESATLAKAFNFETDNPDLIKAKDVETKYSYLGDDVELGTGSVRMFVSIYTGVPYTSIENLPSTAVTILKEHGKWSDTLEEELLDYVVEVE